MEAPTILVNLKCREVHMAQSKPEKVSLDQVLHLVELLPADEQEQLRLKLNSKASKETRPELHPFLDWRIDINQLAAEQGVPASVSVEGLKGDFWPVEDDLEEFVATVRQWRRESSARR